MLAIATYSQKLNLTDGDQLLVAELEKNRIPCKPVVWNDPNVDWSIFKAVLLRSTWDYYLNFKEFLKWLDHLETLGIPTINPINTIRWNLDKKYLFDLEAAGVKIVPTKIIPPKPLSKKEKSFEFFNDSEYVILKPSVSASAHLTLKVENDDKKIKDAIKLISKQKPKGSDILVQPYLPEIEKNGELSLIYFNADPEPYFSHAVLKTTKNGEYRVQTNYGGHVQAFKPQEKILKLAKENLSRVSHPWVFARMDLVNWDSKKEKSRLLLGELELIEPELFWMHAQTNSNDAASVFSQLLAELLEQLMEPDALSHLPKTTKRQ